MKYLRSNFVTVPLVFAAAVLVSVVLYPEVFLSFKTSYIFWNDYVIDYPLTFVLTNFLYQGGLQLWDHFGQMPFFHTYAVYGLFKFPNVITALAYYVLAPFSEDGGRLFHHVFTWANMMTLLLIRVAGIFLLLKTTTKDRRLLIAGTFIFSLFFSQWAFLRGSFYMSYFPLGMYFIVRFFQQLQWRYFAGMFLFFIVCLGNGMHYGAYMYLPMHFFMVSGVLWKVFWDGEGKEFTSGRFLRSWRLKNAAWLILAAVLVLGPYLYIIKFGFHEIAFGQENSRITHPFSLHWYFHNPDLDLGDPRTFFSSLLNIQSIDNMYYLGFSFLVLGLAGLVLSRNRLKYFFGLGVLFLWLLSFPREGLNPGVIAHWINALTNPLKTLPRSFYFACHAMLAFLVMPLAVMGIEALYELYRGKRYSNFALGLWAALIALLVLNALPFLSDEVRVYLVLGAGSLLASIALVCRRNGAGARNFLAAALGFLVVLDIVFIVYQSKNIFMHNCFRRPAVLDVSPQSGLVELDFENPSIFPYRNTYTMHFSYKDEGYVWWPQRVSSDMHHVINQALNYTFLNGYNPRHVECAKWSNDPGMWPYLAQNSEFIFQAQTAVNASADGLSRITAAGLARQVVEVEDPGRKLKLPDQWPGTMTHKDPADLQYSQLSGVLDGSDRSWYGVQGDMIIYTLNLPPAFPEHLASSLFPSEQRYLRFLVEGTGGQWQELQAAQGELIRPNTFDVQNIKQGQLRAAFSKNDFPMYRKCVLLYPSGENPGVQGLWRRQFDNLGITYKAKSDGWLVGHYPYDPKWKISVDGKPVPYYRVNQSFIGFPLAHGVHKILIQYWPHSPLRVLLLISALLTTVGLPALIFFALKWENKP